MGNGLTSQCLSDDANRRLTVLPVGSSCTGRAGYPCQEVGEVCHAAAGATFREVFVGGNTYVVSVAVDTDGCRRNTRRADALSRLAAMSGARAVERLYNKDATSSSLARTFRQLGSQTTAGDNFVFIFSGFRERMGGRGSFSLPDAHGLIGCRGSFLHDDDFTELLTTSVHPRSKVYLVVDAVGSAGPIDLWSPRWAALQSVQLAHCRPHSRGAASGSTSRPSPRSMALCVSHGMSVFGHEEELDLSECLLQAVEQLRLDGEVDYSVSQLYATMLRVGDCARDLALQSGLGTSCEAMPWPLVPATRTYAQTGQDLLPLRLQYTTPQYMPHQADMANLRQLPMLLGSSREARRSEMMMRSRSLSIGRSPASVQLEFNDPTPGSRHQDRSLSSSRARHSELIRPIDLQDQELARRRRRHSAAPQVGKSEMPTQTDFQPSRTRRNSEPARSSSRSKAEFCTQTDFTPLRNSRIEEEPSSTSTKRPDEARKEGRHRRSSKDKDSPRASKPEERDQEAAAEFCTQTDFQPVKPPPKLYMDSPEWQEPQKSRSQNRTPERKSHRSRKHASPVPDPAATSAEGRSKLASQVTDEITQTKSQNRAKFLRREGKVRSKWSHAVDVEASTGTEEGGLQNRIGQSAGDDQDQAQGCPETETRTGNVLSPHFGQVSARGHSQQDQAHRQVVPSQDYGGSFDQDDIHPPPPPPLVSRAMQPPPQGDRSISSIEPRAQRRLQPRDGGLGESLADSKGFQSSQSTRQQQKLQLQQQQQQQQQQHRQPQLFHSGSSSSSALQQQTT